jgi:hypothetical protein
MAVASQTQKARGEALLHLLLFENYHFSDSHYKAHRRRAFNKPIWVFPAPLALETPKSVT